MSHILKDVGPRGLNLNLKGLLFLSNQGSHLAPHMVKYIIWPHRTRMWGLGTVLIYDGPALPNQTWQPLAFFFFFFGVVHPPCDLRACSFQHQGYMDGLVQA